MYRKSGRAWGGSRGTRRTAGPLVRGPAPAAGPRERALRPQPPARPSADGCGPGALAPGAPGLMRGTIADRRSLGLSVDRPGTRRTPQGHGDVLPARAELPPLDADPYPRSKSRWKGVRRFTPCSAHGRRSPHRPPHGRRPARWRPARARAHERCPFVRVHHERRRRGARQGHPRLGEMPQRAPASCVAGTVRVLRKALSASPARFPPSAAKASRDFRVVLDRVRRRLPAKIVSDASPKLKHACPLRHAQRCVSRYKLQRALVRSLPSDTGPQRKDLPIRVRREGRHADRWSWAVPSRAVRPQGQRRSS
jgi:hypothetical protein